MVTALLEATDSWAFDIADIDRGNVNAVVFHIEKLAKKIASGIAAIKRGSGNLFPQQHCILSTKP